MSDVSSIIPSSEEMAEAIENHLAVFGTKECDCRFHRALRVAEFARVAEPLCGCGHTMHAGAICRHPLGSGECGCVYKAFQVAPVAEEGGAEQTFEKWWAESYEKRFSRFDPIPKDMARTAWNAAKGIR